MENVRFSVDLLEATQNLLKMLKSIEQKYPELYEEDNVNNAVKRYECFWMPFRSNRTALIVPPLDVHLVWMAHMQKPIDYRKDCVAAIGGVMDHAVMPEEDLRASIKVSRRMWSRLYRNEPYNHEFATQSEIEPYQRFFQFDFQDGMQKLKSLGQNCPNDLGSDLNGFIDEYKQLFSSTFDCFLPFFGSSNESILELIFAAHKCHPYLFAHDCNKYLKPQSLLTKNGLPQESAVISEESFPNFV